VSAQSKKLGSGSGVAEQSGVHKVVVEHDIGPPQALYASHREQSRIAWPGPHEEDFANGFCGRVGHSGTLDRVVSIAVNPGKALCRELKLLE
jgi:hypothetical protein